MSRSPVRHFRSPPRAYALALALAYWWPLPASAQSTPRALPGSPIGHEVESLIQDLGGAAYERRERAYSTLGNTPDALPMLERHLKTGDAERRRRVQELVRKLRSEPAAKAIRDALAKIETVQVDLFTDQQIAAAEAGVMQPEWWRAVTLLGEGLEKSGIGKKAGLLIGLPALSAIESPAFFVANNKTDQVTADDRVQRILALRVARGAIRDSIILCKGTFDAQGCNSCIVLTNGDVQIGRLDQSILLCDGNVRVRDLANSIIIATGNVTAKSEQPLDTSVVLRKSRDDDTHVLFFHPGRLGIKCTDTSDGVRIQELAPHSVMSNTGLRPGDLVVKLNGIPGCSSSQLSVAMRQRLIDRTALTLGVKRKAIYLEIRIP